MVPGETLGEYELVTLLARDGNAEAWLAHAASHDGLPKKVFLRTLPHLAGSEDLLQLFVKQAQLAAQLSHPNIAQVYDLGSVEGVTYVAMEFVAGQTLRAVARVYAQRSVVLPAWFVLRVMVKVCAGLQVAHDVAEARGTPLLHRTPTPDDIMISPLGAVKILELGVAKAAWTTQPPRSRHIYLAPEQLRGGTPDRRADVYSLGVCLYELCTGSPPFVGADEAELVRAVLAGQCTAPRERAPWVPVALEAIIQRAMDADPTRRHAHAMELGIDLLGLLREAGDQHEPSQLGQLVERAMSEAKRVGGDSEEETTDVYDEHTAVDDEPWGVVDVPLPAPGRPSSTLKISGLPPSNPLGEALDTHELPLPPAEPSVPIARVQPRSTKTPIAVARAALAEDGVSEVEPEVADEPDAEVEPEAEPAGPRLDLRPRHAEPRPPSTKIERPPEMAAALSAAQEASADGFGSKYEIVARIAKSSVAEIFLARARGAAGFQKKIVLKQVLPHLCADVSFVELFLREAELGAQLSHPNIVQIIDFGQLGDTYFIAREYVEGRGLDDVVLQVQRREVDVPLALMVKIAAFAADALHTAHTATDVHGKALGLVHRGVSLSSIMVSFDGAVKLTDFSMAHVAKGPAVSRDQEKYAYMSPQQALGQPIDRRADLFALGVVLYEATTLHRLFRRANDALTIQALLEGAIPPPSTVVAGYPSALEKIVMRCLERTEERRYQDARALHRDLERFLKQSRMGCSAADIGELMSTLFPAEARPLELPPLEHERADPMLELSVSKAIYAPAPPRRSLPLRSLLLALALMFVGSAALWAVILWAIRE